MRGLKRDVVKLLIFVAVAVLITVSVVATLLDLQLGQPTKGYSAVFTNATGLEAGDVVRIAGVQVGKVTGVEVYPTTIQGHRVYAAKVLFSVLSSQHLTTNSTATIQFENLLGQRYLALAQGPPGGRPLRAGATIPVSQTTPGLDLTSVFTGFEPLLAALNPAQVNELTASIIAVFQGEAGAVRNLVSQTARLTSNLADRQVLIDEVLDNLTPLLTKVNTEDQRLGGLIDNLDSWVSGLSGQRQQIGQAIDSVAQLTSVLSGVIRQSQPYIDEDIAGLDSATGLLLSNQSQLSSVLANLPAFLNAVDKVSSSGSYLSVYICDLNVQTSGPVSVKLSPYVPQSPGLPVPGGPIGDQSVHTQVCA